MVLLTIHRFNLRYAGKDYRPGDKVEMDEAKAKELTEKYSSAFSYEPIETYEPTETDEPTETYEPTETDVVAEEVQETAELPVPDVADVVVKPKKAGRKK